MSELARNPRVMERAQSEIRQVLRGRSNAAEADIQGQLPYLEMVIKETLRLHPPAPLLVPRQCAERTNIAGYDVPRGATVFVNAWAIGRDERLWQSAEEFRPERFQEEDAAADFTGSDFRFLPGGAGRRMCPGLPFGLANIQIVLASLLYHFDWKLPNPHEELDMAESYGITARRKADLLLEATPFVNVMG
jgi:cytochrome P450